MPRFKLVFALLLVSVLTVALSVPVFAVEYNLGVAAGQYVTYGNFVGSGPGVESVNDYAWSKLKVVSVSGKEVTLLSTGQLKNGTATPGNGTIMVWNVEAGTEDGIPSTQGPIIAANLNQAVAIPPPNTYSVNRTEDRTYLGVSRSVNILNAELSTPDYNTSLTYVYDKISGMLMESTTQTIAQGQPEAITSEFSYSIIETNIFGQTPTTPPPSTTPSATTSTNSSPSQAPSPTPQLPENNNLTILFIVVAIVVIVAAATAVLALRKKH